MTVKNYKFSWKLIWDSWAKLVRLKLGTIELTKEEKDIIVERTHACAECKHRKFNICTACGCPLPAKLVNIKNQCKEGLWPD